MPEVFFVVVGAVLVLAGEPVGWFVVGAAIGSLIWQTVRD